MVLRVLMVSMAMVGVAVSTAFADGIEPGLWRILARTEVAGVPGPPQPSAKCLTAEQAADVATTFSPVMGTINSECAPLERSLTGGKLTWKLVCKGQLNMVLTGEYNFDTARHYSAIVQNHAEMGGAVVANSKSLLEAEWVSQCP